MKISVIGTGYVGLVTGAVFADMGNEVVGADIDQRKVDRLNEGVMPIYEPGLEEMVRRNQAERRLRFTSDVDWAIQNTEVVFICVGTPPKNGGETDLSFVESVAVKIGKNLNGHKVVVNKSTVPVGTGDFVKKVVLMNKRTDVDFEVVSNPEFLREGSAIADALNPSRVVIGASTEDAAMKVMELYATLEAPVFITDVASAELIKYASNAFLAMKISFINAIANICEKSGANVTEVSKAVGADQRIGPEFLNAGLGYGGSCFPKDVVSLERTARKLGCDFALLREVMKINDGRVDHFISRVTKRFPNMKDCVFGVLGLAFKPNTDDMREAKSVTIIQQLISMGAKIKAYDPVAMDNARDIISDITYCDSAYGCAKDADAIILVTEWREFRLLDMRRLGDLMKSKVMFDGRNFYDPEKKKSMGFEYYGIGKGEI
ncbi:MAG TPA: UDP-glucose/GDP-mannose dehydrogenase family protein [Nitrospinota bacterium]|nr:UDP-glucose/GDP-mannose dehydrogenase family protein [Nitrospinota bacterium]